MIDAMKQALEALKRLNDIDGMYSWVDTEQALRQAIEEAEKQEPVTHAVIAGVLFDFMGWLTSRQKRLVLSSCDDASPAVKVIDEFAKMRGLSLDDAKVKDWQSMTAPPKRENELDIAERAYFAGKKDGIDETIALIRSKNT